MKRAQAVPIAILLLSSGVACDSPKNEGSAQDATAPKASSGSAASASATEAAAKPKKPKFPPQARRNSQPPGMQPLAVGKGAPALKGLPSSVGDSWTRSDEKTTVLVFYRGHW